MRLSAILLLVTAAACRPTSLLELSAYVDESALDEVTYPAAVYLDLGPNQAKRAYSVCERPGSDWITFDQIADTEYDSCPDTRLIIGVFAPLDRECDEPRELFVDMPPASTWIASQELEVFEGSLCGVIETYQFELGGSAPN